MNPNDSYDTFEAADAFHATRLDWVYVGLQGKFVREAKEKGLPVFGTISAELSDEPGGSARELGRDVRADGTGVGNPELSFFVARGDVASEAYRQVALKHCLAQIDLGVTGIHVDDPGMTWHGALHNSGGYGAASMAQFPDYLARHTAPEERAAWGLPADLTGFDYKAYVVSVGTAQPAALRDHFLAFHRESLDAFYTWLRAEVDQHAGRRVPFSCNNGSNQQQDEFPYQRHFDFWLGETGLAYGDPTARGIFQKAINAERVGKVQLFSPPNDGLDRLPDRGGYVALTRRIIATSYACGSATLVPWDVWRRGPDTPRFFGTVDEFGDLYDLIHAQKALYADRGLVYAAGPDITPWKVSGLDADLVRMPDGVFASVRVVPGNATAPVVVHLVDWREASASFTLSLHPDLIDGHARAQLIVPGTPKRELEIVRGEAGWATLTIDALNPYAVLVLHVAPGPGE